jgi:hypothetical protein
MDEKPDQDIATRIMAAMVRMPPKPHGDMKLGESKEKTEAKASRKSKPEK